MSSLVAGVALLYACVNLSRTVTQTIFAILEHVKQKFYPQRNFRYFQEHKDNFPIISVIITAYREDPVLLERVAKSVNVCLQAIPNLQVILIDDGSDNLDQVSSVYRILQQMGVEVYVKENGGKREAQCSVLPFVKGDYVIAADSDTIISPEGILNLVIPLIEDEHIGAATGDVEVLNRNESWLTELCWLRYWMAFNLERAAQSYFGSMMCCSGAFSVYRKDIWEKVKNDYLNQTFLGKKCTYGDDRHLTNLVLGQGYKTHYLRDAKAYTYAPSTIGHFIKQQTRWGKSFYRELLWVGRYFKNISAYSLYDTFTHLVLMVLFILALSVMVFNVYLTEDLSIILYYLLLIFVSAFLKSLFGLFFTKDWHFLAFPLYGYLHITILAPFRLKSLLTLVDTRWGTRGKIDYTWLDITTWLAIFWGIVFVVAYLLFGQLEVYIPASSSLLAIEDPLTVLAVYIDFLAKVFTPFLLAILGVFSFWNVIVIDKKLPLIAKPHSNWTFLLSAYKDSP